MEDKERYIELFLQNNPTASREQAELSYSVEKDLQGQIKRGYANSDGTLNSFVVDRLRDIDVRTPFGMNVDGKYVGPSIEDYIMSGVNGLPKYDVRVHSDIPAVEQELLDIDKMRTHMIGGGRYPNFKVVGEYEGRPNPYNAGYNSQYKQKIEEGTRQSRPEGNQRHVIVKDDNGRIFDLNLDMPHEGLGEPGNSNFPRHLANDPYYTPYKGEDGYRRGNRWRRLNRKDGTWLSGVANYVEKNQAAEDIKINPDGTITHYNSMRYHIPEVEAARIRNAQPDNIFSPSHIFADGGKMSEDTPQGKRWSPNPLLFNPLTASSAAFYELIKSAYEKVKADRLRSIWEKTPEEYKQPLDSYPSSSVEDKRELSPIRESKEERKEREQLERELKIEQLALDTIRGKYGNGKKRKEALGDLYTEVQKRVNEIIKEKQNKTADARRKAWEETPEEWKQPLKSISPRTFNPRSYDLTTDDLRLHELASQQAQQERSLDENPHSLIRDNGEIKRRIGGTNNYDIYL